MSRAKFAVIIPAYNVASTIASVILSLPDSIDHIIVVDDHCPQSSGKAAAALGRKDVTVLFHDRNRGVGGAMVTGYKKALELGCDVIIKMDGDGQMDPAHISRLIAPITSNEADYTKGNRFHDFNALKSMPKFRLFGNSALSFLVKLASGYWNIMDPTNGYTAIHRRVLEKVNLDRLSKRFFFESSMLINLNIINAVAWDIDIPARYGDEPSSLHAGKALFHFPPRLFTGLVKRVFLKYFLYDFNMASVYLVLGLPMFLFGVLYGAWNWVESLTLHRPTPAGTIMLAALPIIVSFQMILQAIHIDIHSIPRRRTS